MPSASPATLVARLADPATDADLLARYAAGRDGAAFAELVRRHGPMVLTVCRRVTRHAHDAEDAFQAAFLVLARKADRLGGVAVGAWLYGVAVRAARKAAARRGRETLFPSVPDAPERAAEPFDPDAAAAVLDEVGRLPEFLRTAVILCELEGRPRAAAARELGVAAGTLSSRLAAARKRLAARLAARGFGPAALAALAPAVVPPRLAAAALTRTPPPGVASLAHGVDRAMIPHKLLAASVAVGLVAVAALATASSAGPADVPPPVVAPLRVAAQPPAPAARPIGPGTILVRQGKSLHRLDPDGKKLGEVGIPPKGLKHWALAARSPDGTRLAVGVVKDEPFPKREPNDPSPGYAFKLAIGPLAGGGEPKLIEMPVGWGLEPRWAPDGASVFVARLKTITPWVHEHHRVDATSGEVRPLPLPDACHLLDVHRDGKTFLVEHRQPDRTSPRLALVEGGTTELRPLTDLATPAHFVSARLSPDGKRVLFLDVDPTRKDAHKHGVSHRPYVLDVATGKRERLAEFPENGQVYQLAWAPDGKRVAYTWELLHGDRLTMDRYYFNGMEVEMFLIVADADGRNAKTVATGKLSNGNIAGDAPDLIDWR
ncbi:MAG TPA: sigma-70 family RNA polymerase sigma factor [Urbifossiella sp.]|nr:sigma-70 family RNA polymerase sigma factor [Urbifossiella sp.]